ncbi:MAG: complex I NDUFA9 subunit family protein [Alphaproteobacteria bacterium]|nr:complex I NDUFA9 subunit family protein [Alphaproteobacteria bacterium]
MQGMRITVFGGAGFVGRYIVKRLAAEGAGVRVACRDPERAKFLKPAGGVGQVVPVQANLRYPESVRAAVEGVDAVVNCVGVLVSRGPQSFGAIHAAGAGEVAAAAAGAGAGKLVHISAIGADAGSTAAYARSKAAGEAAVREAFPDAAILRPSIVIGPEDDFFNRFALLARLLPALPLVGGGFTRFQPAYVGDVADAAVAALDRAGGVFELGGPKVYSFRQLMELLLEEIGRKRLLVPVPFQVMQAKAAFIQFVPGAPITPDQVESLKYDNVVSEGAAGFAELGIEPKDIETVIPTYLDRFRIRGRFAGRDPA